MMSEPADKASIAWRAAPVEGGVAIEELDGRYLLVCLEDSRCFELNATGMFLWRMLERGAWTQPQLIERLSAATGAEAVRVTADVCAFLASLQRVALIVCDEAR